MSDREIMNAKNGIGSVDELANKYPDIYNAYIVQCSVGFGTYLATPLTFWHQFLFFFGSALAYEI